MMFTVHQFFVKFGHNSEIEAGKVDEMAGKRWPMDSLLGDVDADLIGQLADECRSLQYRHQSPGFEFNFFVVKYFC